MASLFKYKTIGQEKLIRFLEEIKHSGIEVEQLLFFCIGTDRSSGDSFGPVVGSLLQLEGYPHVRGTLQQPCDANTLLYQLGHIPPGKTVIAIDACLGLDAASVGKFQVSQGPIKPGQSIGRGLPDVGDYSIGGIVNIHEGQAYRVLQSTSLFRVLQMAQQLVTAIKQSFSLGSERKMAAKDASSAEQALLNLISTHPSDLALPKSDIGR